MENKDLEIEKNWAIKNNSELKDLAVTLIMYFVTDIPVESQFHEILELQISFDVIFPVAFSEVLYLPECLNFHNDAAGVV